MKFGYIFFIFLLLSCSQKEGKVNKESIKFKDLVKVDEISQITVWNNSGKHKVVGNNYNELINKIGNMTLVKNETFNLGAKSIELTIEGVGFTLLGRTNGNYFEVSSEIVTKNKGSIEKRDILYFEATELNIDNY